MFSKSKIWGRNKRGGQILGIFIVVLAAIFIMIAITLSLGRMSLRKTTVENAADSTALMLASHLGSYAKLLSDKYVRGGIEVCHFSWSDLFKIIITIIVIIIAIFVSIVTVSAGGEATWPWVVGMIVSIIAAAANITGTTLYFAKTSPGITRTISRQFKKMGRKMQFKEAAVFHALSKVVDDPVMVQDIYDFDEDGLATDTISRFNFWYTRKTKAIAADYYTSMSDIIDEIDIGSEGLEAILNILYEIVDVARGTLIDATDAASSGKLWNPLSYIVLAFPTQFVEDIFDPEANEPLDEQVYDCLPEDIRDWIDDYQAWQDAGSVGEAPTLDMSLDILNDLDGTVACFTELYQEYLPTWLIGGYPDEPRECDPDTLCTEEIAETMDNLFYNDKFDSLIFTLDYAVDWANAFMDQVVDEGNHAIIDTIDFWVPMLYCGEDGEEYLEENESCSCLYHLFEEAQGNVADIMTVLPIVAVLEGLVGNESMVAEIVTLEGELLALLTGLETVQLGAKMIYEKIAPMFAFVPTDDKYIWNDNRGWHYVNVYVGGFKVPTVRTYRKGCCTRCVKLSRYEGTANVGVSRRDAPMRADLDWPDPLGSVDWSSYGLGQEFVGGESGKGDLPDYSWDVFSSRGELSDSTVYFGDNEDRPLWKFDEAEHTIASYARASWRFKPMKKIRIICTDKDGMACVTGKLDPDWLK